MSEVMSGPETHGFQAEVKRLLDLMIHSLYSHPEIFLRELISNACDACDRLRFEALSRPELLEQAAELRICVDFDAAARTITVSDSGIGMSRQEAIEQLGTIARSGTGQFLAALSGDARRDAQLIGQFGVGFYSAFMVAGRVEVWSRRAGLPVEQGVHWSSEGQGEFSVENVQRRARGTEVILHLKPDTLEFADADRLRALVRRYSDHIAFPVRMRRPGTDETETVNVATALWTRARHELSDEDYCSFYRHIAHDEEPPLAWVHHKIEGKREFTSLLYIPSRAPLDLWNRESPRGPKLYVQRVFILDEAAQLLPLYLRFVRGVIDADDLSLNISREMLQQDRHVEALRGALTKRVLDLLERLAAEEPAKYLQFWQQFGAVLKEGIVEDAVNRQRVARLLRFATTESGSDRQDQSLADYVGRMKKGQTRIHYIVADTPKTARSSPHLERFRAKGVEVLLLADRIDDWVMQVLGGFEHRELRDVARGELDLLEVESAADRRHREQAAERLAALTGRLRECLGERVEAVRVTERLTESSACLVVGEHQPSAHLRRLLEAAGQDPPASPPVLEINPEHPLIARLERESNAARFADLAELLYEQARLAEGDALEDPAAFVKRLNRLLFEP